MHWFSIVNSCIVVIFLSGMVAMIMIRALNRDILSYNDIDQEEYKEETGWKLVHGDVFRSPRYANILASLVGSGCQVFCCAVVVLFFSVLGFLSPANRGALMTCLLFTLAFLGVTAGFASAITYKSLGGDQWRQNTMLTATLFPSIVGGTFFFLNLFVWHEGSTAAIPFLQAPPLIHSACTLIAVTDVPAFPALSLCVCAFSLPRSLHRIQTRAICNGMSSPAHPTDDS